MSDNPYLSKLLTDLGKAVKATDFLRYQRLLADCRHYYSANDLEWAYPMPDKALSFVITQIQPVDSVKEADQIKIIKSLIAEEALNPDPVDVNSRIYTRDNIFRLACVYGSPTVVKVLLAAGCQVTAELLAEVIGGCTRDFHHTGQSQLSLRDQVLLLLLDYYLVDLHAFNCFSGVIYHDVILPGVDRHKYGFECLLLDKPELNRAILKSGIYFDFNLTSVKLGVSLLDVLESTRPYHAVKLFVKLGWLDVDTVESYSRDREEPLEYLTRKRLEEMAE